MTRALAIVMVVMLHVAAAVVVRVDGLSRDAWWVANLIDAAMRPAVPLFVMVSGLLLLDPARRESDPGFLAGRARRILGPFLTWVAIYLAWRATYHGETLSTATVIREVVRGPVYTHLWFLYMMLGLYLLGPILRAYARGATRANQGYFVVLWLVTAWAFPIVQHGAGVLPGVAITLGAPFSGYFLLGHVLRADRLSARWRPVVWAALLLLVGITAVGTAWLSARARQFDGALYDYLSLNVVAMSVLLFLLLRSFDHGRLCVRAPRAARVVAWVASGSFGIYLVHPIFQELYQGGLLGVRLDGLTMHPAIGIPVTTALVLCASAMTMAALNRLPFIGSTVAPGARTPGRRRQGTFPMGAPLVVMVPDRDPRG